jgi:hypothetical protein
MRHPFVWTATAGVAAMLTLATAMSFVRKSTTAYSTPFQSSKMDKQPKDAEPHARFPEAPATSRQRLK